MRLKPIFTPSDLRRFEAQGRGLGSYENFIPWHRVNRSDPSSMGRSHLLLWRGRQRELLSDQEMVACLFATMHPDVVDIREQFPLNLYTARHELNTYQVGSAPSAAPGTIELAEHLKIKHPLVREPGTIAPWILTTDLVLTLQRPSGEYKLLAISVKPANAWQPERTRELLMLELEYWSRRNVTWLLITPALYETLVADTLKGTSFWALTAQCNEALLHWLSCQALHFHRKSLTHILEKVTAQSGCSEIAKCAFWHSVWTGRLPFDLRRSWRPSAPFILLGEDEFWQRNPIVSRRSAWST